MLGTFKGAIPKLTALDMISFVANKGTGFSIDTAILTVDALKGAIATPINTGSLSIGAAAQVAIVTDLTSSLLIWKDGLDSNNSLEGSIGSNLIKGYAFIRNCNNGSGTVGIDSNNKQIKQHFDLVGSREAKSGISIDGAIPSTTQPTYKTHGEMVTIIYDNNGFDNVKAQIVDFFANNSGATDASGDPIAGQSTAVIDANGLKASLAGLINNTNRGLKTKIEGFTLVTGKKLNYDRNDNRLSLSSGQDLTNSHLNTILDEIIVKGEESSVKISEADVTAWNSHINSNVLTKDKLAAHITSTEIEQCYLLQQQIVRDPAVLNQTIKVPMRIIAKNSQDKVKVSVKQILNTSTDELFEARKCLGRNDTNFSKSLTLTEFFNYLSYSDKAFDLTNDCEEARKVFFLGLLFGDDADKQSRIISLNLIPNFNLTFSSGAQTIKGFAFSSIDCRVDGPILHMIQEFFVDATMSITNPNYIPVDADYGSESHSDAAARAGSINTTFQKVLQTKHDASIDDSLESINKSIGSEKALGTKQARALSGDSFGNNWFSKNGSFSINFALSTPVLSFIKGFGIKTQLVGSKMLFGAGIISTYQGIELI